MKRDAIYIFIILAVGWFLVLEKSNTDDLKSETKILQEERKLNLEQIENNQQQIQFLMDSVNRVDTIIKYIYYGRSESAAEFGERIDSISHISNDSIIKLLTDRYIGNNP